MGSNTAFLRIRLAVLTAFSTFPFDRAWYGEDVICSKSHFRANVLKSHEENWEPLLLLTMFGMPCLANCNFRLVITDEALVSDRARNSKKLE